MGKRLGAMAWAVVLGLLMLYVAMNLAMAWILLLDKGMVVPVLVPVLLPAGLGAKVAAAVKAALGTGAAAEAA